MRNLIVLFGLLICLFSKGQNGILLIPNKGQFHQDVIYKSTLGNGNFFIDNEGFTYDLVNTEDIHNIHEGKKIKKVSAHAVKLKFLNANTFSKHQLQKKSNQKFNYYKSKNSKYWISNVCSGQQATIKEIYPGIHLQVNTDENGIKYNFILEPGANPNDIKYEIIGAKKVQLNRGNLEILTSVGNITDLAPKVWQADGTRIISSFNLDKNIVSYNLERHDSTQQLIIDPSIVFSTYSGSNALNFGYTATYDDEGFLYAGGSVFDAGYPVTAGAYDVTFNSYRTNECGFTSCWGVADIAISKYDTSGTTMIYSTYIGGSLSELPHSLIVNNQNELYIYGTTGSDDYPVSSNAYDTTFNGGTGANLSAGIYVNYYNGADIIVSKLSADGGTLDASTYLGGSLNDGFNLSNELTYNYADQIRGEIILSPEGFPIIASSSFSLDYPITAGAIQNLSAGGQEGVVTSFNYDLSQIRWSTFIGGAQNEAIYSIDIGPDSSLYIAGGTSSPNFPTTVDAYEPNYLGNVDGFMTILRDGGDSLIYGSFFGTAEYDQIYFIRADLGSNVYVFGQTEHFGGDLIFNAGYNIPNSGQFITKFDEGIQSRTWSTVFGSGDGKVNISPTAFKVDLCNRVYLTGWGSNSGSFDGINQNRSEGTAGMQVTPDAFQSSTDNSDYYFLVLEDDASTLTYATYFGGPISEEHVDGGTSRFDRKGILYQSMCAGCGFNSDLPIVPANAVGPINNNNCNNAVLKFDFDIPSLVADFLVPETGCADTTYSFVNTSKERGPTNYLWRFGDGNTSTDKNPTHQYNNSGSYLVTLVASDPASCNQADSISKTITIRDPLFEIATTDTICIGDTAFLNYNGALESGANIHWEPASLVNQIDTTNTYAFIDTTTSFVFISEFLGCSDSSVFPFYIPQSEPVLDSIFVCRGDTLRYDPKITGAIWSSNINFTDTLNSAPDTELIREMNSDRIFYLSYHKDGCSFIDSLNVYARTLGIIVQKDSIVCSSDSVLRTILSPNGGIIQQTTWSPSNEVFQATDTSAYLNPYAHYSTFYIEVTDTFGCVDRDTINIIDNSLDINLSDTTICKGDSLSIEFDLDYNPLFTYEWIPGNLVRDPDSLRTDFLGNDTAQLQLIIDNGFCRDTVSKNIHVIDLQTNINIIGDTTICALDSLPLSLSSTEPVTTIWQDLFGNDLNFINPPYNWPIDTGNNFIQIMSIDSFGCEAGDTLEYFNPYLVSDIPNNIVICSNINTTIQSAINSSSLVNYRWEPDAIILSDTTLPSATLSPANGINNITLFTRNTEGCKDTAKSIVYKPQVAFDTIQINSSPSKVAPGDKVTIRVNTDSQGLISWTPIAPAEVLDRIYELFPDESMTLIATIQDSSGQCRKNDTTTIEVVQIACGPPYVFVPNAFTPNNDGENDILFVRGRAITEMYFAVFNRWGQKVFESTQLSDGWDGYFQGEICDPAVYDFYLEYSCDGVDEQFMKGNITLIR